MNPLHRALPLLVRHAGVWEGEYRYLAPDGALQERLRFRILAEIPDTGAVHYRQSSHYWWPDGRTQRLVFEAAWREDRARLGWDDGRIHGELWQVDATTLYLAFGFHAEPGSRVCEMMQLSACGERRLRTWHWFRDGRPSRVTLVQERRVGAEAFAASLPPTWPPDPTS